MLEEKELQDFQILNNVYPEMRYFLQGRGRRRF